MEFDFMEPSDHFWDEIGEMEELWLDDK